jgi:hypothetical protein
MFHETTTPEFKAWLVALLNTRSVTIIFAKRDGTIREMRCTLAPSLLPTTEHKLIPSNVTYNTTLVVFDLQKFAWRSFTWEALSNIRFDVNINSPTVK